MSMPHWKNSEGRVAGCLPRASKPGELCPLFSERIKVIPRREWSDILEDPNHMDLWPSVPVVLDQDGVGSCATESTTGGVMLMRSFNGQSFELLNPWFVYHTTSGGRDSGSNIDSNLAFAREHGIAPESVWPRSKGFRATPSAEAKEKALSYRIVEFFDISNEEEFGSALLQGFAVVYGRSGHSILAITLVDDTKIRMLNSWGNWGDNGTAVERLSGVRWSYGVWAVRVVTDTRQPLIVPASELVLPRFEPCPEIVED